MPALVGVVERLAELRRTPVAVGTAATAAAARGAGSPGHRAGGLGVPPPHLLAQLVGRRGHQQHTPFRSATAASFSTASRLSEKKAHLPRCSRSSRPASTSFFRWWDTVGCASPTGSFTAHPHASPPPWAVRVGV